MKFPIKGTARTELLNQMKALKAKDANWNKGKTWSLVYYAGEEITAFVKEAYQLYFHENGLNPLAFPSLRTLETEVVSMTADLFHGDEATVGSLTSGGSESILMAVKTYRDLARQLHPEIKNPEVLLPITAHPAFEKAAHYFDVKTVHIPLTKDYKADIEEARKLVSENTILIVGSAPAYPHGVVDPITELAGLALERGIPLHVDACLGGFILPFVKELGHKVPEFDFKVAGVTSISADLHKYGYASKGVSVVLYRNKNIRQFQYFAYDQWPGGLFASPTALGTRPGGAIASAWAVLNYLGKEGYLETTRGILRTTEALLVGIQSIPEFYVLGEPEASVFAIASDKLDLNIISELMSEKGWHMDLQQFPESLHFMVTPAHEGVVDQFLFDLKTSVNEVREKGKESVQVNSAFYGMEGALPEGVNIKDYLIYMLNELMTTPPTNEV